MKLYDTALYSPQDDRERDRQTDIDGRESGRETESKRRSYKKRDR